MRDKNGATRARSALACAVWGVAALTGCMLDIDDPAADDEADVADDGIGQETEAVTGGNLGGANLAGANLGGANLAGANLGGANLGGTNLAGANLGGANLGGANLGGNNLGGNNLAATNLAGANLAGSTATGSYVGLGCPISGTTHLGTDLTLSTVGVDIHALGATVANKTLRSGEEAFTRTKACIVMGIGSTALAKLIGQNSGTTMYAAVRLLPWGFAATKGGAVTLNAWEVVMWGSARYSVFIVASPKDATYAGVTGFIKAVWRWAAPTTKTLKIGQIGGGQTVQTYTGMMNAGAQVLASATSEKSYIAGELAFATATTNNQVVNVDFASWVRKSNNTSALILGNVAGSPPWAEGSIMALDMPDGSVQMFQRRPPTNYSLSAADKLYTAYQDWQQGRRSTKPVPRRCAGWLLIKAANYNEVIPSGKCDPYLTPAFNLSGNLNIDLVFGAATWASAGATAQPYSANMVLDSPSDSGQMTACTREHPDVFGQCDSGAGPFPVISETYIHLWDPPYDPYP